MSDNQTPEQKAREVIDTKLEASGWAVINRNDLDWKVSDGIAVREYLTSTGPADYVLFVDKEPVGVIEAKGENKGKDLREVETQSGRYASSKVKYRDNDTLPFVYESTGTVTHFTDMRDPKPRSREVFSFHRPETLRTWLKQGRSLRERLQDMPGLDPQGLRACQILAINNLEHSFKDGLPKALVQMATGSGKTFTAITSVYRLLKYADAKKILFLVDTRNLGEQAEEEFMKFISPDDNWKFTELYNVQRLKSNYISSDSQVCISTIQRLYSILKDEELGAEEETDNPAEKQLQKKEPVPVVYNEKVPVEEFDFIVVDECHRSIYNVWQQVLDYFDAFIIGLTATPDTRTFGFFNENVVSEYGHEQAVADGVNVGQEVYIIETHITKEGGLLGSHEYVGKREKLTRRKRWEQLDEDYTYSGNDLNRGVVNPSQIRKVIRTFRSRLPEIFPGRREVPKTLIFALTDSHADDIIEMVREEFGECNDFCRKVTYRASEDPKSLLSRFRNDYYPRIAVTVDMIATGTDVKPLECLLFMRDVKSRNYFEQMKGRGTRTLGFEDLKKVTPSATSAKTHFVIVDAVGVTSSLKTDSRPLERKRAVPIKELVEAVTFGEPDEDTYLSLSGRLAKLDRKLTPQEKAAFEEKTGGKSMGVVIRELLASYDPDVIESVAEGIKAAGPIPADDAQKQAQKELTDTVRNTFTGELNDFIVNVHRVHEQIIDNINMDTLVRAEWDNDAAENAARIVSEFQDHLLSHKDEITALSIFYDQPYRRREITFRMIKELLEKLKQDKPLLAPPRVWKAYEQLEKVEGTSPKSELTALVGLIRHASGLDPVLTSYELTVNRNFKDWVFSRQAGPLKFTEEQMDWLRLIRDHVITSYHLETDDLDYAPFDSLGGRGRMYQLFGDGMGDIIAELNEVLVE